MATASVAVRDAVRTSAASVVRGDRIVVMRMGLARYGRVEFVTTLQVFGKWDDGRSTGLRLDRGMRFHRVDGAGMKDGGRVDRSVGLRMV